jgi:nucleoside-diphosphate-sugar epimerase
MITNKLYQEDIAIIASCDLSWKTLKNSKILITGATGLIGTFLIDLLMYRNSNFNDNIIIYAVGRNQEKAKVIFKEYFNSSYFIFIEQDIRSPIGLNDDIDYIIHGASNTHPIAYAKESINTILLSVMGTKNILDFAYTHKVQRTLFLSTVEIYGENRGDTEQFKEDYCGYIDCNTVRAGYPEGKRVVESLCQAYIKEKNIDIVIARCCRVYGPTMGNDDSKAIAQFIRNASNNKPIVLKSKGMQQYSYCYVADICSALLVILLNGQNGEAYNISDNTSNFSLSQIAAICADVVKQDVIFDIPSQIEASGYSKVMKALMDNTKLLELSWQAKYTLPDGIRRTVQILSEGILKKD